MSINRFGWDPDRHAQSAAIYGRLSGYTEKLSTVRGYARSMGLPAVRLGRHRVSSPALIDGWLLSVDRMKRKRLEPVRAR